jgi:ribonucleotide monophosphatase NagD (HAD superfamily)
MTNSGGTKESAKAQQLSNILGLTGEDTISPNQMIVSHTPMQFMTNKRDREILLVGKNYKNLVDVMVSPAYNFDINKIHTCEEIHELHPIVKSYDLLRATS